MVCRRGPFLKPNIPMEISQHLLQCRVLFWHSSFASKLYPQKKAAKRPKSCNLCIGVARSDTNVRAVTTHYTYTLRCQQHLCTCVVVETARDGYGNIVSRGGATRSSDTLAVALAYYSSFSSCRHILHSVLAPSECRTAMFGNFCLMYTHLSARSMVKRLRLLL
jgi:hypothetical protein